MTYPHENRRSRPLAAVRTKTAVQLDAWRPDTLGGASDRQLVDALRLGRPFALDEIHRRHALILVAQARRILGDRSMAEDVVQDVLLALWRDNDTFDAQRGTLRCYLSMKVHGRAVDSLRADQRRRRREDHDASRAISTQCGPEARVIALLDVEEMRAAFVHLHQCQRDPIVLAYVDGHSYRDVARILGTPEGTVKSRIRAGLRRLGVLVNGVITDFDDAAVKVAGQNVHLEEV